MQRIDLQELSERKRLGPVRLTALGASKACQLSLLRVMTSMIRMIEGEVKDRPDLFQGIKLQLSQDALSKSPQPKKKLLSRGATGEPWWMAASALTRLSSKRMLKDEVHDTITGFQAFISSLGQRVHDLARRADVSIMAAYEAEERRYRRRLGQSIKARYGVDAENLMSAADVRDQVQVSVQSASALVRGLGEDSVKRLEFTVLDSARKGESTTSLSERIRKELNIVRSRARLIARDQAASLNSTLAKTRQEQFGIDSYIWQTAMDERVRHEHAKREGKVFNWDDPPNDGHPGEPINCFPGSTVVDLSNGYRKLWRRSYSGPFVTIMTSHGRLLQATPNHPILTPGGWKAINDLDEGDQVIAEVEPLRSHKTNADEFKIRFKDLFNSFARSKGLESGATSPLDFHGDSTSDYVDIISVYGDLTSNVYSSLRESLEEFKFSRANVDVLTKFNFSGSVDSSTYRLPSFPQGLMSSTGELPPFIESHLGVSHEHGCTPVSHRDSVFHEDGMDNGSTDLVLFREGKLTGPLFIGKDDALLREMTRSVFYMSDEVIRKTVEHFSGPVFNMETDTGHYIANAIVVHNCRCVAIPFIENKKK